MTPEDVAREAVATRNAVIRVLVSRLRDRGPLSLNDEVACKGALTLAGVTFDAELHDIEITTEEG